jgi:hypothetical protein
MWLRIGTGGAFTWIGKRTFGLQKIRESSELLETVVDFHEGLCTVEVVGFLGRQEGGWVGMQVGRWVASYFMSAGTHK